MKLYIWPYLGLMVLAIEPVYALQKKHGALPIDIPIATSKSNNKKTPSFSFYNQKDLMRAASIIIIVTIAGFAFYKGTQVGDIQEQHNNKQGTTAGREYTPKKEEPIPTIQTTQSLTNLHPDPVIVANSTNEEREIPIEQDTTPITTHKKAVQVLLAAEEKKEQRIERINEAINLLFKDVHDEGEYWAMILQPIEFDSLRTIDSVLDNLKQFLIIHRFENGTFKVTKK